MLFWRSTVFLTIPVGQHHSAQTSLLYSCEQLDAAWNSVKRCRSRSILFSVVHNIDVGTRECLGFCSFLPLHIKVVPYDSGLWCEVQIILSTCILFQSGNKVTTAFWRYLHQSLVSSFLLSSSWDTLAFYHSSYNVCKLYNANQVGGTSGAGMAQRMWSVLKIKHPEHTLLNN